MISTRRLVELTFREIPDRIGARAILCLPIGSIEQHGPHLPLNTDVVLAEAFTERLIARYGSQFDLWQLPTLPVGLAREHDWAPGTLSLSVTGFATLLREWGREIARALPAKNLMIVNGHGGNRAILEPVAHELRGDFGLNVAVLHPAAFWSHQAGGGVPEIHGGRNETSAMLAVAPELVRMERVVELKARPDADAVRASVLDPTVTWPWTTNDARLADLGVIGDPSAATAEFGEELMETALKGARGVLERLVARTR